MLLLLLVDGMLGEEGFLEEGLLERGGLFYYERLGCLEVVELWWEVFGRFEQQDVRVRFGWVWLVVALWL